MDDWVSPQKGTIYPHAILLFLALFPSSTVASVCGDEPELYMIKEFAAIKKAFSLHHYYTFCTLWNAVLLPLVLQMKGHRNTINGDLQRFKHKRRSKDLERKSPVFHSGVLLHIWLPFEGGVGLHTVRQPLWSVNTYPHMYGNKYKTLGFLSDNELLTCTRSNIIGNKNIRSSCKLKNRMQNENQYKAELCNSWLPLQKSTLTS